jgi:hypothetical protein
VDNSFGQGIGHRLDGWANRDLNVGAIVALALNLKPDADLLGVDQATVRAVLNSWGPGHFDAELFLHGKAFRSDGKTAAVLVPPAFGLPGVNLHTWTGWGSVTYWNAFVANLGMHGKGAFFDPRLNDATQFPVAAAAGFGNVRNTPDLITPNLADLQFYQLGITAPKPPKGSFEHALVLNSRLGVRVFLPFAFRGFGHVFGRRSQPIRFSAAQVLQNVFRLTLASQVHICRFGAHGVKKRLFVAFYSRFTGTNVQAVHLSSIRFLVGGKARLLPASIIYRYS